MSRFPVLLVLLAGCATEAPAIPLHEGPSIEDPPPSMGIGLFLQDPADRTRYEEFERGVQAHTPGRFRLEREGTVQDVSYDGRGFDYTSESPSGSDHQRCLYLDHGRLSGCKPTAPPPPEVP